MKRKIFILIMLAALLLSGCGKNAGVVDITSSALDVAQAAGQGQLADVMEALGSMGLAACDVTDNISTVNPEVIENWFSGGKVGVLSFYQVCTDGGFVSCDLLADSVTMTRVVWANGSPRVSYSKSYAVESASLSDRGFLIINRSIADNPKSGSLHDGYVEPVVMVRVSPIDLKCRELRGKYISPVGYGSRLFTADWNSGDMSGADVNGVFVDLYNYMYGKAVTYDDCPWTYDTQNDIAAVPAAVFETVIGSYFDLSPAQLKALCGYDSLSGTYPAPVSGLDDGRHSVPAPDVTGYAENADGTVSIYVSAVDVHQATDAAFSHVVTVRPSAGGGVYIGNEMIR